MLLQDLQRYKVYMQPLIKDKMGKEEILFL